MQSGPSSHEFLTFILNHTKLLPDFLRRSDAVSLALTSKDMLNTVSFEYNKLIPHIKVIAVAGGYNHSLILTSDGRVLGCGDTSEGKLGYGLRKDALNPIEIQIPGRPRIAQIEACTSHSLFLTQTGKVFSCGVGQSGQLGHGNRNNYFTPTEIPSLYTVVQIAGSEKHTLFLTQDGKVLSFGSGVAGQLGHGNQDDYLTPTEIPNLENIVDIAAEGNRSFFLRKDGKVLSCGYGMNGTLGHGNSNKLLIPTEIPNIPRVKKISLGNVHTLLLTEEGRVLSCGFGEDGRLGHGNKINYHLLTEVLELPKISQIKAGTFHSIFLAADGRIFSCGNGVDGPLGHGNWNTYFAPTEIIRRGFPKIASMATGYCFTLFLAEDGKVFSCGRGYRGNLGHGDQYSYCLPTEIPKFDTPIVSEIKIESGPQSESWASWLYDKATSFIPSFSSQNNDAEQSIQRLRDEDNDELDQRKIKRQSF